MKFPAEILVDITNEEWPEGYTVLEEGEWIQDGKYQHKEIIFSFNSKNYLLIDTRSGSPFTDWYYQSDDWSGTIICPEVQKVEVTKHEWKVVN